MSVAQKLKEKGLLLPPAPSAIANYVPATRAGDFLFLAGQLPLREGKLTSLGKVGAEVTVEEAKLAAETATLNALAVAQQTLGDL